VSPLSGRAARNCDRHSRAWVRVSQVGVHYGHQLGHEVPWCTSWPFTWISNPQYVGVVLTFWGIYLALAPALSDPAWFTIPLVISFWYFWSCNLLEAGTPRHTLRSARSKGSKKK
jgi:hypothetical protein